MVFHSLGMAGAASTPWSIGHCLERRLDRTHFGDLVGPVSRHTSDDHKPHAGLILRDPRHVASETLKASYVGRSVESRIQYDEARYEAASGAPAV